MTTGTQLDRTLHAVLETFVERGYPPHYTELAARFGVGPEEGKKLVHDLAATGLPVWLYPGTDLIASCAPFNAQPTQYRLSVDGRARRRRRAVPRPCRATPAVRRCGGAASPTCSGWATAHQPS